MAEIAEATAGPASAAAPADSDLTLPRIAACITLGATALLVLGLQPLLLAALAREGRLAAAEVGMVATVEILAIAFGSALGVPMLKRLSPLVLAAGALLTLIVVNAATAGASGFLALAGFRAVSGLASGLIVAIPSLAIARWPKPGGAAAAFLLFQAAVQFCLLAWLSWGSSRAPEADTILVMLAFTSAAGLATVAFLPRRLTPPVAAPGEGGLPPAAGMAGLAAWALFVGGAIGIWTYLGVWLDGAGFAPQTISAMLTVAMAGQMLGAIAAMRADGFGSSRARIIGGTVLMAVAAAVLLGFGTTPGVAWGATFGFCIFWMFATPAFASFMVEVDPTRRSLPYGAPTQLIGAATLPTLAGLAVHGSSIDGALLVCGATLGVSLLLLLAAGAMRRAEVARVA